MATAAEIARIIGNDARLMPRFPVSQPKQDGSVKIRPVDDGTRAGINAATMPSERLTVDGVDQVRAACRALYDAHGYAPVLWKADVDAAYRRIPLAPGHVFAAWSAGYRGGWDTRGNWNASSHSSGKGNLSSKGDNKGKRKQPDVPRTPEKRHKHS